MINRISPFTRLSFDLPSPATREGNRAEHGLDTYEPVGRRRPWDVQPPKPFALDPGALDALVRDGLALLGGLRNHALDVEQDAAAVTVGTLLTELGQRAETASPTELRAIADEIRATFDDVLPGASDAYRDQANAVLDHLAPLRIDRPAAYRDAFREATTSLTGDLYNALRNAPGAAGVESSFVPAFDALADLAHRLERGESVPLAELTSAARAARAGLQDAMANTEDPAFDAAARGALDTLAPLLRDVAAPGSIPLSFVFPPDRPLRV